MGKFLNALFNKQTIQPSAVTQDPAAMGRPVPVAYITEPPSALTSDAALNQAAVGAWPELIDGGAKFWNGGWRKSVLREVSTQRVLGNYGTITSDANYGFKWRAFAGIGNMPGPVPTPYRPTYNDLTPVVWHLRVANPNIAPRATSQNGPVTIQNNSSTWPGSSTASLKKNGTTLL